MTDALDDVEAEKHGQNLFRGCSAPQHFLLRHLFSLRTLFFIIFIIVPCVLSPPPPPPRLSLSPSSVSSSLFFRMSKE